MTENLSPYQVVTDCPSCGQLRRDLTNIFDQVNRLQGVEVVVRLLTAPTRDALESEWRVNNAKISCERCGSTGQVLTEAGLAVVRLLAERGALTAGQLAESDRDQTDPPTHRDGVPF